MATPFVKICGLSTPESVDAAVRAGADAVGFVFAASVRQISAAQARELAQRVPDGVETVGVFRASPIDEVIEIAKTAGVTTIQFHGHEPLADVLRAQAEGFRTVRAFGVDEYAALSEAEQQQWDETRLLVDAVEPGGGVPFDPDQLERGTPDGFWLLAGGLTPGNVTGLIKRLRPSGVDVSSGVESTRGVKSLDLIADFVAAAKQS